jgi:protein TonB
MYFVVMKLFRTACIFSAIAIHGLLLASIPEPVNITAMDSGGSTSGHISVSLSFQQAATAAPQPVTEQLQEKSIETQQPAPKAVIENRKPIIETAEKPIAAVGAPAETRANTDTSADAQAETAQQPEPAHEQPPAAEAAAASRQTIASGIHHNIITEPLFANSPKPPSYPSIARKRGQQGVVWLDIKLDKDGEQTTVEVFQSSGIRALDRAALKAVKQWQFLAHKVGSITVASHIRIPVEFSLD